MASPSSSWEFPRTYRVSAGWTVFLVLGGLAATVGGAYGAWYFGVQNRDGSRTAAFFVLGIFLVFILFGLYAIVSALKARIVLYPDRIELHEVLNNRTLALHEIVGRRRVHNPNGPYTTVLLPRSGLRKIKLSDVYQSDEPLMNWISDLPDLDARDLQASREEILGGPHDDDTRRERKVSLAHAKRLSNWLMIVGFVAAFWGWFFPRPYTLVISVLILLPWLAVLIISLSHGMFRMDEQKNDAHPNVAILYMFPGFVLTMRALDFQLLGWKLVVVFTIVITFALWIVGVLADSSLWKKRLVLIVLFLLTGAYGYGACVEANCLLDGSTATIYSSRILGKHVSSGRSTTYYLRLAPWGPTQQEDDVSVSRAFYNSIRTGETVCLPVKRGALRISWFVVERCH